MNRVIIIGSQGSGKSTLARLLSGALYGLMSAKPGEISLNDENGAHGNGETYRLMTEAESRVSGKEIISSPVDIALVNSVGFVGADSPYGMETLDPEKWAQVFMTMCVGNPSIPYDAKKMAELFGKAMALGIENSVTRETPAEVIAASIHPVDVESEG